MEDLETLQQSIESCISILLGNLQQPGIPAVVLKLSSSWKKVKPFLKEIMDCNASAWLKGNSPPLPTASTIEQGDFQVLTSECKGEVGEVVCAREEQSCAWPDVAGTHSEATFAAAASDTSGEKFKHDDSGTTFQMIKNGKQFELDLPVKRPGLPIRLRINSY